jgi:hypothetical protein
MHRRQRTFAEMLTRSLASAGLLYALVFAYAVPASLLSKTADPGLGKAPDLSALTPETDGTRWMRAHAARFPGCVDVAQWAARRVPTTVVVLRRDGALQRMPFDEAYRRATSASAADDVWTVGACG